MTLAQVISDYENPKSLGSRFRKRRSAPLRAIIEQVYAKRGSVSILDVGGMEYYWRMFSSDFLRAHKVKITLLNLAADLRPIKCPEFIQVTVGDGCAMQFADNEFDICHSNSVIEHVGTWSRKVAFAREVTRVAPRYFHQTPNFWFPWEPHFGLLFYHWLPEPTKLAIACRHKLSWTPRAVDVDVGMQTVEHATLLNRRMFEYLFPQADIRTERLLGLAKSFIAVKTGFAEPGTVMVGGFETTRAAPADLCNLMVEDCRIARATLRSPKVVFDLNGHALAMAQWDRNYRADLLAADLIHADGQPCVIASRVLTKTPIAARSVTTDYFHDAATAAVAYSLSFYLLGATEQNNAICAEKMTLRYPGLVIAGRHNGFFTDERDICDKINASKADIIWVGMGKPREQSFCIRNRDRLRAGWMVTCGGCFNYVAGTERRAPLWMQKYSLEWAFRLAIRPQLLWRYLTTNPIAAYLLLTRTRTTL